MLASYLHLQNLNGVVMLIQLFFIFATINFTFMISLMFRSTKAASDVGVLLIFSLIMMTLAQNFLQKKWVYIAFGWIPQIIYLYGIGDTPKENWIGLIVLIVESIVYFFLFFYLEQIIPNIHGVRKPPLFFLRGREKNRNDNNSNEHTANLITNNKTSASMSGVFQP